MLYRVVNRAQGLALMISLVLFCAVFLPSPAQAATTVDKAFTPPITRENGGPLTAAEIASYQLYAGAVASGAPLPAAATKITVPACTKAIYTLTVTDTGGLTSKVSDPWTLVPDGGCAPGKVVWVP